MLFILVYMPFIYFYYFISLARISLLSWIEEMRVNILVFFQTFIFKYDVSSNFFIGALYKVEKFTSIPTLLFDFIMNGWWVLSNALCDYSAKILFYLLIDW